MNKLIFLCFSLMIFVSCHTEVNDGVKEENNSQLQKSLQEGDFTFAEKKESPSTESSAANSEIYDFMTVVINEQKLNRNFGLILESSECLTFNCQNETFLEEELLIKKTEPAKTVTINGLTMPAEIKLKSFDRCLTHKDIDTMLTQMMTHKNSVWNNDRLGFNLYNDKNYYCFSVPLFSVNKTKAVMQIRNLCPGLCGTSETFLFQKQNGSWTSQSGGVAYH
ncbi:MAG: hypothetical protein V4580_15040 [Bacteroidota bacterium]